MTMRIAIPAVPLCLLVLLGCGETPNRVEELARAESKSSGEQAGDSHPENADSLHVLDETQVKLFTPGRDRNEILQNIGGRGNFEMATELDGQDVCAISYGLFGGPHSQDARATSIWAIFVDGKFVKFVDWPAWSEEQISVGDFNALRRAWQGEEIHYDQLAKHPSGLIRGSPSVDPGLVAAFLPVAKSLANRQRIDQERNAELRAQFHPSRLSAGMTVAEVEDVFDSEPLEQGHVDAGDYRIYGSTENLDLLPDLHYCNVLTLFKDDKLAGIYSGDTVPGGPLWRADLAKHFSDLPPQ